MVEAILNSIISKLVEVAGNLIVAEGSRLYWLPEELRWLKNQLCHLKAYTTIAEANHISSPKVAALIKQIRDLAPDVKDAFDDFLPKIESYMSRGLLGKASCILSYGLTCSKFAREIQKIRRRVEAIGADRTTFGISDAAAQVDRAVAANPRIVALHVDESVVVGLKKDINDLMNKLLGREEALFFMSIIGMPGVGKTTLAKKCFKHVRGHFDHSASVSVSNQPNVEDLLVDIAKQVGLPKGKQKENLETNLHAFLWGKRYILLLDDIWDEGTWDKLAVAFPLDCTNRSRIVITSRHTHIGRYIGTEKSLHQLKPLDFPTSWDLFNQLITPCLPGGSHGFKESKLGEIGRRIVQQCGGLPLAIVVTVGMLRARGTNESAWNEVLRIIEHDTGDRYLQILALSYRELPSVLKPCFLYLATFAKDHMVKVSELVRLWMAEKLISGCSKREAEDVGEMYVNELVSRNLVEVESRKYDGRVKSICVHNLLHSLCLKIARDNNILQAAPGGVRCKPRVYSTLGRL